MSKQILSSPCHNHSWNYFTFLIQPLILGIVQRKKECLCIYLKINWSLVSSSHLILLFARLTFEDFLEIDPFNRFKCTVVFPNDIPVFLQILANLIKVSDFHCSCFVTFSGSFLKFSVFFSVGSHWFHFNLSHTGIISMTSNRMFLRRYYQSWMEMSRLKKWIQSWIDWAKPAEML